MGIVDKIKEIEDEIARTQKNKATEYHMGQLKAKRKIVVPTFSQIIHLAILAAGLLHMYKYFFQYSIDVDA